MYKLLCGNLTKSHKSLTNFTGYYRKVAQKYNEGFLTGKRHASETDLLTEENSEPAECQEESEMLPQMETKTRNFLFDQKIPTPLCPSGSQREKQIAAATNINSRFFHATATANKNNIPQLKRPFKSKEAQEYYKTAIEQCMRIKYKLDKYYQQATMAARPPKLVSDIRRELENAASARKIETLKLRSTRMKKEKAERQVAPELMKIATMKSEKDNHQFKEEKFRITYPTHTIRYKLGTYKLQHKIKKQAVSDQEVKAYLRNPIREPLESTKVKHDISSEKQMAELQEIKYKMHQKRLPHIASLLQKNSDEIRQMRRTEGDAAIKQHPTVRRANATTKMAFKTSYNKLLKKSRLVYKGPGRGGESAKIQKREEKRKGTKEKRVEDVF